MAEIRILPGSVDPTCWPCLCSGAPTPAGRLTSTATAPSASPTYWSSSPTRGRLRRKRASSHQDSRSLVTRGFAHTQSVVTVGVIAEGSLQADLAKVRKELEEATKSKDDDGDGPPA